MIPQHGVPRRLVSAIGVVNLTAIDVAGDGRSELAGSFVIKQGDNEHAFFVGETGKWGLCLGTCNLPLE
jgi:hypothetical protein